MAKLKLFGGVCHDGKMYATGDIVDISDKADVDRLIKLGVAGLMPKSEPNDSDITKVEASNVTQNQGKQSTKNRV